MVKQAAVITERVIKIIAVRGGVDASIDGRIMYKNANISNVWMGSWDDLHYFVSCMIDGHQVVLHTPLAPGWPCLTAIAQEDCEVTFFLR